MKKIFMMAVMAVAALSANAQVWVGGSFALDFSKNSAKENMTSFEIAPEVGYNLSDKWAVAMALGFGTTNNSSVNTETDLMSEATIKGSKLGKSSNYFKVAPYARFSFAKWDKVSLFLDGGFGFRFFNNEGGSQFNVGINPGIAFTPTEKISLVARFGGIGYQKDSEKHGNGSKFGIGLDNKINFGVFYNF